MVRPTRAIQTVQVSIDDELQRLERAVRRMEARYGCSTAAVQAEVASGARQETREISDWLINYRAIISLRDAVESVGLPAGYHTSGTR